MGCVYNIIICIYVFTTRIEKYLAVFYAECPSCRNPPHLSGLGTGTKAALI